VQDAAAQAHYGFAMQTISQEEAIDVMPIEGAERTRFWRDSRFMGMECLTATFITHEFAPHAHETFSIGAIEAGSQISKIKGERSEAGPGYFYLINPDEIHDGHPGGSGYRYRMVYPSAELLVSIIEDVTGRAFKGTPSFSKRVLQAPDLALSFHQAHRTLEVSGATLEAEEKMFAVLAAMFERHGPPHPRVPQGVPHHPACVPDRQARAGGKDAAAARLVGGGRSLSMRFCRPGAFQPSFQGAHRRHPWGLPRRLITFVQDDPQPES